LRRRSSQAVLAVRASDHGERRARRGGRPAARADRADGVPLPRLLRQRQRAQGARGPHRRARPARRAAACGRYGVGHFIVFVAFRIPNLLRRLFAEGAFSQAFVPVLAEYKNRLSHEETRTLIDGTATALFLALVAAAVLGIALSPLIVYISASGFAADQEKF